MAESKAIMARIGGTPRFFRLMDPVSTVGGNPGQAASNREIPGSANVTIVNVGRAEFAATVDESDTFRGVAGDQA